MSDNNEAGRSSKAATPPHDARPDYRSKVTPNFEINEKSIQLYKDKTKVYLKIARGVDPKPFKIFKYLGDGQYKLSRDGKSDGKVYKEEDLQTEP